MEPDLTDGNDVRAPAGQKRTADGADSGARKRRASPVTRVAPDADDSRAELEALRTRVATLEAELVDRAARTNAALAAAQERVYWLDRWHLDLNAVMRKPGAEQVRAAIRAVRAVFRFLKKLRRRFGGS